MNKFSQYAGVIAPQLLEQIEAVNTQINTTRSLADALKQAANQIATLYVPQLQKLRYLLQKSITMQANYMAQMTERENVDMSTSEKRRSTTVRLTNSKEF